MRERLDRRARDRVEAPVVVILHDGIWVLPGRVVVSVDRFVTRDPRRFVRPPLLPGGPAARAPHIFIK